MTSYTPYRAQIPFVHTADVPLLQYQTMIHRTRIELLANVRCKLHEGQIDTKQNLTVVALSD